MTTISNSTELINFLSGSVKVGEIINNIDINENETLLANGLKILTSSAIFQIKKTKEYGMIYSLNNVTNDGYTVGNTVDKDMYNLIYNSGVPSDFPNYFPDMSPLIDENIVTGDKPESEKYDVSLWYDWDYDIFDRWGNFYLYDVESGKYYFPLISPQNQADGVLTLQTFNAFGRTFTINHGYPVQGIFKFDISVNDNKPFKFGAYGNMGSDGNHLNTDLTYSYIKESTNLTLYYVKQEEINDDNEIIYSYFVPKKVSENNSKTYNLYQEPDEDNNSLMSNDVHNGIIVYFSAGNDVKEWVVNDLNVTN